MTHTMLSVVRVVHGDIMCGAYGIYVSVNTLCACDVVTVFNL